ncbi:hypothetical protein NHH88_16470 [Oxalobacteraceae bacterium OTU3CAMAD1]|nr:hypothetical protein NHH88_16470 [Oxalobacteraceae bacterium OTU3CAMAD1]
MSSSTSKNKLSGVVTTYKKGTPASTSAIGLNLIKKEFHDSIEYKGSADGSRGMVAFFGSLLLLGVGCADFMFIDGLIKRFSWFDFVVTFSILAIGNTIAFFVFLKALRTEFFRPIDEPIIFDRKNRKIYRILSETKPGWRGLLSSWPLKVVMHDWDLVKAEHHVAFNADGSTLNRMHALVFSVQKSDHDQTIIDSFMLGNSIHHGEQTVPAVYEHVRRFMEEGGPRLPPGEMITNIEKPASFMQCMARSGPYGENFKKWWKNARFLTIIWLFFFPITIPIFTLLGIFSWLSYSTSISISWPAEVLTAIGPELNEK